MSIERIAGLTPAEHDSGHPGRFMGIRAWLAKQPLDFQKAAFSGVKGASTACEEYDKYYAEAMQALRERSQAALADAEERFERLSAKVESLQGALVNARKQASSAEETLLKLRANIS